MSDGKMLHIPEDCNLDQLKLIMHYAADTRKFEIGLFWQRSLFFWGFIGAAFIAYASLHRDEKMVRLFIACFGIICSLAWMLQNRGSKYWQEAWEQKVEAVEVRALRVELFKNKEILKYRGFWGPARYSVSRLTIALSYFTVLIWGCLLVAAFPSSAVPSWLNDGSAICLPLSARSIVAWAACLVTAVYAALLFCRGKSSD